MDMTKNPTAQKLWVWLDLQTSIAYALNFLAETVKVESQVAIIPATFFPGCATT